MGKTGKPGIPGFCLNRIRPHVKVRSPTIQQSKPNMTNPDKIDEKNEDPGNIGGEEKDSSEGSKPRLVIGRKIMIVVDSSNEAKGALQWALSHTVQGNDLVLLLHVTKPSKQAEGSVKERSPRAYALVNSLKDICQLKRPEIKVDVAVLEGKEKGPLIVEEAKKQGIGLLVVGQKKRSMTWRLLMMWATNRATTSGGHGSGSGVVEYCIQNAECMAIAVRRKSKKHGGYLITTKRHKDFWLLC